MGKILGLDLGAHSVKGVLIDGNARGYRVLAAQEVPRPSPAPNEDPLAGLRLALSQFGSDPRFARDSVIVAVPGAGLATHPITLPFGDPKKVEAALGFEIESQLPYDLSEAVYDYQPAPHPPGVTGHEKTELSVGVLKKEELKQLLALLREQDLEPRIVTHAALALQNYLMSAKELFSGIPEDEAVALIDIGHERTNVAIGRPGFAVEFGRTFAAGGRELTRAVATELQTPVEQAASWKEEVADLSAPPSGPDYERARNALLRGMQPIYRELRPTLKAYSARSRRRIHRVFLCGGTAQLKGICERWSRDLGITVEPLQLPAEGHELIPAPQRSELALAYALALRGNATGARAPRFNLRRGEFAFKGDFDYLKEKAVPLVAMAAALILMLIASGVVRNAMLSRREKQVDQMLCDTTQRILGACEKNYDRALNLLKGKESPAAAVPKVSAVGILSEVTARVPDSVSVTFDQISVDPERVTLRGEIDSPKSLDQVSSALRGHRCFKEVKEGKMEKTRDGQKLSFRLDVEVSCSGVPTGTSGT